MDKYKTPNSCKTKQTREVRPTHLAAVLYPISIALTAWKKYVQGPTKACAYDTTK